MTAQARDVVAVFELQFDFGCFSAVTRRDRDCLIEFMPGLVLLQEHVAAESDLIKPNKRRLTRRRERIAFVVLVFINRVDRAFEEEAELAVAQSHSGFFIGPRTGPDEDRAIADARCNFGDSLCSGLRLRLAVNGRRF